MTTIENIDIEFKELDRESHRIPPSVVKTLVAFLNTEGGDLFIGIQDNGNVCGVHDADDTSKRLSSLIHDAILPDASPFISLRIVTLEERRVVRASVMVGTDFHMLRNRCSEPNGGD